MRRIQDVALTLFERRGFEAVTVDDVARAAEVGVASVFRNFGTKEGLVWWDEYDPLLFEGIAARLGKLPPLEAVCEAACAGLDQFYSDDKKRLLRRTDLAAKTPALAAAPVASWPGCSAGSRTCCSERFPTAFAAG